ncbi:MAG: ZIP family metal transporter [Candidatus Omnitrophota bacterium]|nr:ZIP family metal transporter [Candidatus Omnitrophota bacterium]
MQYLNVIIYSLIAGIATMLGTAMLFYKEAWARKNSLYLVSFAAGVMLATAFLDLLPEAVSLTNEAMWAALSGILLFYVLQQSINLHPCHDEECQLHNLGILSLAGLTFHSLIDGIAIALGFGISVSLGTVTTLAVILHEVPEGITTTSILMYAKMPRKKVIWYSALVALSTPLAAILFYPFVKGIPEKILGLLLGLAAGSFIYVAASDLIPQTHKIRSKLNAIILLSGVIFLAVITKLIEH